MQFGYRGFNPRPSIIKRGTCRNTSVYSGVQNALIHLDVDIPSRLTASGLVRLLDECCVWGQSTTVRIYTATARSNRPRRGRCRVSVGSSLSMYVTVGKAVGQRRGGQGAYRSAFRPEGTLDMRVETRSLGSDIHHPYRTTNTDVDRFTSYFTEALQSTRLHYSMRP